jgi:hypothetical protein
MSIDTVRKHIRAALDDVVASEKQRLHEFYDKSDARIAKCIEVMRPVIDALTALQSEVSNVSGLSISTAGHGHMATVELKGSASSQRLSISTAFGNAAFEIKERAYSSWNAETAELIHNFSTADEVLEFVLLAVGKHVASNEVLNERRK